MSSCPFQNLREVVEFALDVHPRGRTDRDLSKFSIQPRGPFKTGTARLALTDMLATALLTGGSSQVPVRDP